MSLANRVLSELELGQWGLSTLAPSFQRRLASETKTSVTEKNISELCLGFYSQVSPREVQIRSFDKFIDQTALDAHSKTVIQNIFRSDFPEATLGSFEPDISRLVKSALFLVESKDLELSNLVSSLVTGFIRINGVNFRSASHPQIFGLIAIGDGIHKLNTEQLATSIAHETAHQELFLVNMLDRLVEEPYDYNEVHAPFQGRKRPPIGRLHSMWALYRMVQFQKKSGEVSSKYLDLLEQNIQAFEPGELTPFGVRLVEIAKKRAY